MRRIKGNEIIKWPSTKINSYIQISIRLNLISFYIISKKKKKEKYQKSVSCAFRNFKFSDEKSRRAKISKGVKERFVKLIRASFLAFDFITRPIKYSRDPFARKFSPRERSFHRSKNNTEPRRRSG